MQRARMRARPRLRLREQRISRGTTIARSVCNNRIIRGLPRHYALPRCRALESSEILYNARGGEESVFWDDDVDDDVARELGSSSAIVRCVCIVIDASASALVRIYKWVFSLVRSALLRECIYRAASGIIRVRSGSGIGSLSRFNAD